MAGCVQFPTSVDSCDSVLIDILLGSADTTRTVLTTIFMYMLRDPRRFRELQEVLDNTLGQDELPSHDILSKISLLDAYINEGLRLNPPLPFHVQRVVPEGGAVVAGYFLPEGTHARLASYSIQRDPRYFADPHVFLPERWMAKATDDVGNLSPFEKKAFLPL
jgi:cytochrome P450